jgi:CubicO group peptidase (beta-lactamase class C family)
MLPTAADLTDGLPHPVEPERHGMSSSRLRRIRPWLKAYVDSGKIPGAATLVARQGQVVFFDMYGMADRERARPIAADTIFRIYSMTKPLTSVAAMMLVEQGLIRLDEPVDRFVPELADMTVFVGGDHENYQTEPAREPITLKHLLTHTSGLTYDFVRATPVDKLYRNNRIFHVSGDGTLAEMMTRLGALPLLAHPGAEWNYSVSTDALGYLIERVSGQAFDRYLSENVLEPLGMTDTGFHVPQAKHERFASCYAYAGENAMTLTDPPDTGRFSAPRTIFSGGGGLVSTMTDYLRFALMLMNKGELDGTRLLGRKTVEYITTNHLPGDMASMGQPRFSEASYEGIGFGLGFSVVLDPTRSQVMESVGTYAWGGAASTAFWCDPIEDITTIFLTQLEPSSSYPIRAELRTLVNQAIID